MTLHRSLICPIKHLRLACAVARLQQKHCSMTGILLALRYGVPQLSLIDACTDGRRYRYSLSLHSKLCGMRHDNCCAIFLEDPLHQDFDGLVAGTCLDVFTQKFELRNNGQQSLTLKGEVMQRLLYLRKLHGTNIPSQGLENEKMTAEVFDMQICTLDSLCMQNCTSTAVASLAYNSMLV